MGRSAKDDSLRVEGQVGEGAGYGIDEVDCHVMDSTEMCNESKRRTDIKEQLLDSSRQGAHVDATSEGLRSRLIESIAHDLIVPAGKRVDT